MSESVDVWVSQDCVSESVDLWARQDYVSESVDVWVRQDWTACLNQWMSGQGKTGLCV